MVSYYTSEKGSYFGNDYKGLSYYIETKKKLFNIIGYHCHICTTLFELSELEAHHPDIDGHEDIARFKTRVSMYRYYVKHPDEAHKKLKPICQTCHTGFHGW